MVKGRWEGLAEAIRPGGNHCSTWWNSLPSTYQRRHPGSHSSEKV